MRRPALLLCAVWTVAAAAAYGQAPKLAAPPPGFGPQAPAPKPKATEKKSTAAKDQPKKAPAPTTKAEPRTTERAQRTAPAATVAAAKPGVYGPGQDVGDGFRACIPGDTTPAGTVTKGYRKFEATTPFGRSCGWQKAEGVPDTPAPASVQVANAGPAPGIDVGGGYRGCVANDDSPAGTEKNGYRKVVGQTAFGNMCRWEPIQGASAVPASVDFRPCDATDSAPAGTVRDGYRKVEGVTVAGKTCRWERIQTAQ